MLFGRLDWAVGLGIAPGVVQALVNMSFHTYILTKPVFGLSQQLNGMSKACGKGACHSLSRYTVTLSFAKDVICII